MAAETFIAIRHDGRRSALQHENERRPEGGRLELHLFEVALDVSRLLPWLESATGPDRFVLKCCCFTEQIPYLHEPQCVNKASATLSKHIEKY